MQGGDLLWTAKSWQMSLFRLLHRTQCDAEKQKLEISDDVLGTSDFVENLILGIRILFLVRVLRDHIKPTTPNCPNLSRDICGIASSLISHPNLTLPLILHRCLQILHPVLHQRLHLYSTSRTDHRTLLPTRQRGPMSRTHAITRIRAQSITIHEILADAPLARRGLRTLEFRARLLRPRFLEFYGPFDAVVGGDVDAFVALLPVDGAAFAEFFFED